MCNCLPRPPALSLPLTSHSALLAFLSLRRLAAVLASTPSGDELIQVYWERTARAAPHYRRVDVNVEAAFRRLALRLHRATVFALMAFARDVMKGFTASLAPSPQLQQAMPGAAPSPLTASAPTSSSGSSRPLIPGLLPLPARIGPVRTPTPPVKTALPAEKPVTPSPATGTLSPADATITTATPARRRGPELARLRVVAIVGSVTLILMRDRAVPVAAANLAGVRVVTAQSLHWTRSDAQLGAFDLYDLTPPGRALYPHVLGFARQQAQVPGTCTGVTGAAETAAAPAVVLALALPLQQRRSGAISSVGDYPIGDMNLSDLTGTTTTQQSHPNNPHQLSQPIAPDEAFLRLRACSLRAVLLARFARELGSWATRPSVAASAGSGSGFGGAGSRAMGGILGNLVASTAARAVQGALAGAAGALMIGGTVPTSESEAGAGRLVVACVRCA